MALALTESLIKSRVNLSHENLEDIKSLSLPGTYHEKILSVGTSLRKFTRLKSLDFSRNALESLQGLEHLQLLEKLNLYYNNIGSLEELTRLKHNPNLQEIDLRLNPVTRNEPDYRLYLIHLLPNLRKLDDRGVRDRERQAALTHFSSSQAAEMSVSTSASVGATTSGPRSQASGTNPNLTSTSSNSGSTRSRQEMMAKLMKGPSALVDDDVAVMDAMEKNEIDFGKSRSLTGSAATKDTVEDYSIDGLKKLDQPRPVKHSGKSMDDVKANSAMQPKRKTASSVLVAGDSRYDEYRDQYPNIMAAPIDSIQWIGDGHRKDPNLHFPDEVEANSKYRGQGYFTPNPEANNSDDDGQKDRPGGRAKSKDRLSHSDHTDYRRSADMNQNKQCGAEVPFSHDDLSITPSHKYRSGLPVPGREIQHRHISDADQDQTREKTLLYALLNLVDRYWNGSKSLHKHPKFIEQALQSLSEYTMTRINRDESHGLRRLVEKLQEENAALMIKVEANATSALSSAESELRTALRRAKDDMGRMHQEIKHYIQENQALQKLVDASEAASGATKQHGSGSGASDMSGEGTYNHRHEAMQQELELMRAKVKQFNQMQELAAMLQESHRSLVETNEHLLREIIELKQRHKHEIEQMDWNYRQLKATLGYANGTPTAASAKSSLSDSRHNGSKSATSHGGASNVGPHNQGQ